MYYEKYLNRLHTSSGWASDADLTGMPGCVQGAWDDAREEGGVILLNHGGRVLADGGDECRHVLVIGATGTGKSRLIIIPSLLYSLSARSKRSYVVFDVKGELEAATSDLARKCGYTIRRVDFRDPEKGSPWNPFLKINTLYKQGGKQRNKAVKLLEDLIAAVFNDGPSSRSDPFWRNTSASLFRGICYTIWESNRDLTLSVVLKMAASITADSDYDSLSPLFSSADELPKDSPARRNLEGFRNGSNVTRGNVLTCFNSYITHFTARDDILEMMTRPKALDFQEIGLSPTVLYISLPDDSTALGGLQGMLLTQMIQDLNDCAMKHGGRLPVRTEIYLDELCNIRPAIPGLETALTISRSRGIRYVLAIQSYSQLEGVYGAAAGTISANCSTWIALNIAKDESFRLKLSQLCGHNPLGDPLITPAQLSLMRYEEGVIIRERTPPFYTQLEDLSAVERRLSRDAARQSA